jgi:hypothetical protein
VSDFPALFTAELLPGARRLAPALAWPLTAQVLIVATCLQESGGRNIAQAGGGPARGYPQFERGGIAAVMSNSVTSDTAREACAAALAAAEAGGPVAVDASLPGGGPLKSGTFSPADPGGSPSTNPPGLVTVSPTKFLNSKNDEKVSPDEIISPDLVYAKFIDLPELQMVFARLMYLANPPPLPKLGDVDANWAYYLSTWRPGAPRPADWPAAYRQALEGVVT